MTAKTSAERSAKTAAKRARLSEEELRHRVRPGTKAMLGELMEWNGIKEQAKAIQLLILNAHAAGPAGSAPMLATPRHEIAITENVARRIYREGAAEADRLDRAEA